MLSFSKATDKIVGDLLLVNIMYMLDKFFKCREIILLTNMESIDGSEGMLNEWDEYLRYYDRYINQDGYERKDYERELLRYSLDEETIDAITNKCALYLTDRIIKMSEGGDYVLLKMKEYPEWLSISEFDILVEEYIKKRGKEVLSTSGQLQKDVIEHQLTETLTLDELLHYFDELESNEKIKVLLEKSDEDEIPDTEKKDADDILAEIMVGLGLIKTHPKR